MLTIIYPFRNRDIQRVRNSFESLKQQTSKKFEVYLVDYGSKPETGDLIQRTCKDFPFVSYRYCNTRFQPWNKSRALNFIIRDLETDYFFVADVDMIFRRDFVAIASTLQKQTTAVYFQVGFLEKSTNFEEIDFSDLSKIRKSTAEATGLCMFPVSAVKKIRGFDEFYHFWGAEDTDILVRLRNSGLNIVFHEEAVLLLHQWHPSYRSRERKNLTEELQIKGIVQLNHHHLLQASARNKIMVNRNIWGSCTSEDELEALFKADFNFSITTDKKDINELLFCQLPEVRGKILKLRVTEDPFNRSLKFFIKKILGKKVPKYYTLKEVNDKILLHLISFYREKPYYYKVHPSLKQLEMAVKL